MADDLRPHLLSEVETNRWPGTELLGGGTATVRSYRVNAQTLAVLGNVPDVFAFVHPDFPEDLAFYTKGKLAFASIAHEREAWYEA